MALADSAIQSLEIMVRCLVELKDGKLALRTDI